MNNKNTILFSVAILVLAFAVFGFSRIGSVKQVARPDQANPLPVATDTMAPAVALGDYKNSTYTIDGKKITLVNGSAEMPIAPGSASKLVTKYFGNNLSVDLNGDGKKDEVFYLTQNTGGTGTFFYIVAALAGDKGYTGSMGYFVGDRIAPQTINLNKDGTILVNYADRKPSDSFATSPSEGKTLRLIFDNTIKGFGLLK